MTGPTGSGKSTTLASIIDRINETRACHILTIEDPVEYVHKHKLSAVSQREIGLDSPSFDRALRSALREDPDVLLIGEMRDIESIQIALTMAETGHLGLRHPAHQRRPAGHRPDHRRVSGLAPGADQSPARQPRWAPLWRSVSFLRSAVGWSPPLRCSSPPTRYGTSFVRVGPISS